MIELNDEQKKAYARFIKARDRVGLNNRKPSKNYSWVPMSDYSACVDVVGLNHPLFVLNEPWIEYKEAFLAWLATEPPLRDLERMRMSRGDYGQQDSWDDRGNKLTDVVTKIKE